MNRENKRILHQPLPSVSGDQESFLLVSSAILSVKGWLGVLVMEPMVGMPWDGEEWLDSDV